MLNNQLNKAILSYYSKLGNSQVVSPLKYDLIKNLISKKGEEFVEQKFHILMNALDLLSNDEKEVKELYSTIFPNLVPSLKRINAVFENAINNISDFVPLYNSSEFIYRQWLFNFKCSHLFHNNNMSSGLNINSCKEVLAEFQSWIHKFPELKVPHMTSSISRDLGELPLNAATVYSPKSVSMKFQILQQLERNAIMQMTSRGSIIEVRYDHSNIIVTKKGRYSITPQLLQKWLSKFGIDVTLITTTYLIEFGMPYGGELIPLCEILRYTNNGYGIVGLLAERLNLIIRLAEKGTLTSDLWAHPLRQSVVLALARLEHFLNTMII